MGVGLGVAPLRLNAPCHAAKGDSPEQRVDKARHSNNVNPGPSSQRTV